MESSYSGALIAIASGLVTFLCTWLQDGSRAKRERRNANEDREAAVALNASIQQKQAAEEANAAVMRAVAAQSQGGDSYKELRSKAVEAVAKAAFRCQNQSLLEAAENLAMGWSTDRVHTVTRLLVEIGNVTTVSRVTKHPSSDSDKQKPQVEWIDRLGTLYIRVELNDAVRADAFRNGRIVPATVSHMANWQGLTQSQREKLIAVFGDADRMRVPCRLVLPLPSSINGEFNLSNGFAVSAATWVPSIDVSALSPPELLRTWEADFEAAEA